MNSKVDEYITKAEKWQQEMSKIRAILLDCGLQEELKWGVPCYMCNKKNLFIIGAFKESCVLSFLNGVLLSDSQQILERPGENSQSVGVVRFTDMNRILELESTLKTYIFEAMEVQKLGLKVNLSAKKKLTLAEELVQKFEDNPDFKAAFEFLTPGRQRGYNMYFTAAKQSKTRVGRIEQYTQRIFNGKGIHDCVCGHSKRMPNCDGSHKFYD